MVTTVKHLKGLMDKDRPHVLIDLRSTKEARKGHIAGAVSIPAEKINAAKNMFPRQKGASIMLYAVDKKTAREAFTVVRGWGYRNASVIKSGIGAWKNAGHPLVSDKLAKTIVYVPMPTPGSLPIEEFKRIVNALPPGKFILDVREVSEAEVGMLISAKVIPVGEVAARADEIPKDKEIIIHCAAGVRAEMAYHTLKGLGFKTRFLDARITIDKDGRFEITEH